MPPPAPKRAPKPKKKGRKAAKRGRRPRAPETLPAPFNAAVEWLPPNNVGRPSWRPSEKEKAQVAAMAGYGVPITDIARIIGVDGKTLSKHLDDYLKSGKAQANLRVAQTLFQLAVSGTNLGATIFWCKSQMGFREVQQVQQLDAQGNPVDPVPSGATFIIKVER